MSQPAADTPQYYLGINGDQTGPYSEADIIQKIQSHTIPEDALVWHEGLDAWLPISGVPAFAAVMGGGAPPPETAAAPEAQAEAMAGGVTAMEDHSHEPPVEQQAAAASTFTGARSKVDPSLSSTFTAPGQKSEPVFKGKEAVFSRPAFLSTRLGMTLMIMTFVGIAGFAFFYWQIKVASLQKSVVRSTKRGLRVRLTRGQQVRKALSQLILKPTETLPMITKLVEQNADDAPGKEALAGAIDYYRRNRRHVEAGNLLMTAKKPLRAAEFYLYDPPDYRRAEAALFSAYENSKDPDVKFESLVRNVSLLLGPLNSPKSRTIASGRIQILSKDFPNKPHPFGYYLKTTEQKIGIMFERVSFHFSEGIENLLEADFPDISLGGSPTIELKKNRQGKYRVVATYNGEVLLGRDQLPKVNLTFWSVKDKWYLVGTNLTAERRRWANVQKRKLVGAVMSKDDLLVFLESIHLNRFPKVALHDPITKKKPTTK